MSAAVLAVAGLTIGLLFYGVHSLWPAGAAATPAPLWPGWDHARGVVTRADGRGGYILDAYGGLHPFSLSGAAQPPVRITEYWDGWAIARAVSLRSDGHSGYVLDGYGGLHPFGIGAALPPEVTLTAHWNSDFARAVTLRSDGQSGYVLDAWGGLHPFGVAGDIPPAPRVTSYWIGWDFARAVALVPGSDSGYTVGEGGLTHPFNPGPAAPALPATGYTPGYDRARGVALDSRGTVYVVSNAGYVTRLTRSAPWTSQLLTAPVGARGIAFGSGRGADGVIVDAYGAVTSVSALAATGPPPPTPQPTPTASPTPSPSSTLKQHLTGFLDRQGVPAYSWMTGYVVNARWADLQPTQGGPIARNNVIDQAIATAQASGRGLKVRLFAGGDAPDWTKALSGGAVTVINSQGATCSAPRYWNTAYQQAYAQLQVELAAIYDTVPEVREVTVSENMLCYAEPGLHYDASSLQAAGDTLALDEASYSAAIQAQAVWTSTLQDLAFNPNNFPGEGVTFMLQEMSAFRATFGSQGVLENNSLRAGGSGPQYDQMYAAMATVGSPISFQTATAARMGDPATTFALAVSYGASSVELPSGYTAFPEPVLLAAQALLIANP